MFSLDEAHLRFWQNILKYFDCRPGGITCLYKLNMLNVNYKPHHEKMCLSIFV